MRAWLVGCLALGLLATPALVATASPSYAEGDRVAFEWMEAHAPRESVISSSLDATSVLFREHGFTQAIAFQPRRELLDDFWYGANASRLPRYLASLDYFVLRDDARRSGFVEFGPLREPVSPEAYAKFGASRDLHRVFDNGDVEVYQVQLAPERFARPK